RWINPPEGERKVPLILLLIGFFLLGIYGGFIQMGMGIIFLAFSVLVGKFDMLSANAMKIICVGSYTGIVLFIFAYNGWVNWWAGGLIAIGQIIGALVSSKFASGHPKANIVAHRLLIVVVVFAIV